jgi:hypothetical protein
VRRLKVSGADSARQLVSSMNYPCPDTLEKPRFTLNEKISSETTGEGMHGLQRHRHLETVKPTKPTVRIYPPQCRDALARAGSNRGAFNASPMQFGCTRNSGTL